MPESRIEFTELLKPSGGVRGFLLAFASVRGKRVRIAHAYAMLKGPMHTTLTIPRGKLSPDDVKEIVAALQEFHEVLSPPPPPR